jgi:hypothetical protein
VKGVFRETVPMPDEKFERLFSLSKDWGVRTRWQEIDQTLYGAKKLRGSEMTF